MRGQAIEDPAHPRREPAGGVAGARLVGLAGVVVVEVTGDVRVAVAGRVDGAAGYFVDQRGVWVQAVFAVVGVESDVERERGRRPPCEGGTDETLARLPDSHIGVRDVDEVAETVAAVDAGGQRQSKGVVHIGVAVEPGGETLPRTEPDAGAGAGIRARPARHDVDRAADGVSPVQGALRPAQHLDALNVREIPVLADLAAEIDAVHVHADAGVRGNQVILGADAADEGIRRGRVARGEGGDGQVGHELADIDEVRDAALHHLVAVEDAERGGYVVEALLPFGRGDDHFLDQRGLIGDGRPRCQHRYGQRRESIARPHPAGPIGSARPRTSVRASSRTLPTTRSPANANAAPGK